jgi:hypothetical protein
MIKCPECGHSVSSNAPTCPGCGIRIAGNIMKCPECGEIIIKGQELCPHCHYTLDANASQTTGAAIPPETPGITGAKVEPNMPPQKKKSNVWVWVVVILAIFIVGCCVFYYVNKNNASAQEESAYEQLEGVTDTTAYNEFLSEYPDSRYREDVEGRLKKLVAEINDWNEIANSCSSADFVSFLANHPNTVHQKECEDKIDSLDWIAATTANTPDAFKAYLSKHPNGKYVADATTQQQEIAKTAITPEDKSLIRNVFSTYFSSLSNQDESGVCSVLAPILDNFLNKHSATKNDVLAYMRHIVSGDATTTFTINNDYRITKKSLPDGEFQYNVTFSVDQNQTKEGKSTLTTYTITGSVTTDGKISILNMRQVSKPAAE